MWRVRRYNSPMLFLDAPDFARTYLERYAPDSYPLLGWLCDQVDAEMLMYIARSDYDRDVEAHFEALQAIRLKGEPLDPLYFIPKEVLQLNSSSQIDESHYSAERRKSKNLICAFCCTVLVVAENRKDNSNSSVITWQSTVPNLIQSLLALNHPEQFFQARQLLSWALMKMRHGEAERPVYAFCILLMTLKLCPAPADHLEELDALCDWIRAEIEGAWTYNTHWNENHEWMAGLTYETATGVWKYIVASVLNEAIPRTPSPLLEKLQQFLDENGDFKKP